MRISGYVLPLYYIAFAIRKWGGVYGVYIIFNMFINDFSNNKRNLIDDIIHKICKYYNE